MTTIDFVSDLTKLTAKSNSLAELMGPMCALLTQATAASDKLVKSEDENLGHLEEALRKPLGEFLAAVLQRAAQQKADATPPKCPHCGAPLTRKQKLERTIKSSLGEIKVNRVRGYCRKCKEWVSPADDALGLQGGYSPQVQEMAALFASKMPIAEASAVMERATGIKMPPATLDRVAKQAAERAKRLRDQRDTEARQGLTKPSVSTAPETLIISMDAWNIRERDDWGQTESLRKAGKQPERWHWVWTGTVFNLSQRLNKQGRAIIAERGYVATRDGLEAFGRQLHAEAQRAGLGQAKRVVVIGDGAVWIWKLAEDRFKEAIQRIDIYHVKQHLWAVARELHGDTPAAKDWVKKMKSLLRRGQAVKLIKNIEEAVRDLGEEATEGARKELNYLKQNQKRMTYASGLKRGEPIGSGVIESTCGQYQCRFKRPGQFWTKEGDDALLCLETFWRNQRWDWLFPHTLGWDPSKN